MITIYGSHQLRMVSLTESLIDQFTHLCMRQRLVLETALSHLVISHITGLLIDRVEALRDLMKSMLQRDRLVSSAHSVLMES